MALNGIRAFSRPGAIVGRIHDCYALWASGSGKTFKVSPDISFNLSKSGVSVSARVKGARVTVGKNGVRKTVGIPGTGVVPGRSISSTAARRTPAGKTLRA